jgi:hypothetical protein
MRRELKMTVNIEEKASKLRELSKEVRQLKNELREDILELERKTYDGRTYDEHLKHLMEQESFPHENDKITIKSGYYQFDGYYQIDKYTVLEVTTPVYDDGRGYIAKMQYKESGRTAYFSARGVPAKYQAEYEEIVEALSKLRVKRITKEYVDEFSIMM